MNDLSNSPRPSCADFIVSAVRETRPPRKNIRPGRSTGKGINFIYALAHEVPYSDEEFRHSIKQTIEVGAILLVARVVVFKKTRRGLKRICRRFQQLPEIPAGAPLDENSWSLNSDGQPVDPHKAKYYTHYWSPCLYVVADGLPGRIAKNCGRGKAIVEKILTQQST
jgi:hypothetical protein